MMDYEVIIATYNGEKYIVEQLNSILNQTIAPSRIIIRDDGSTDKTREILTPFLESPDSNIKLIYDGKNLGYIKNFETLLKQCNADIVFFADQDDIWKVKKAETLLALFQQDKNANVVFSDAELFNNKNIMGALWEHIRFNPDDEPLTIAGILRNNVATGATMAARTSYLINLLPFPHDIPHDYWITANAVIDQCIIACKDKLISYRQHENNQIGAQKTSLLQKIKDFNNPQKLKRRLKNYRQMHSLVECLNSRNNLEIESPEYRKAQSYIECVDALYRGLILKEVNKKRHISIFSALSSKDYIEKKRPKEIMTDIIDAVLLRTISRNMKL